MQLSPEKAIYHHFGVRKENPEAGLFSVSLLLALAEIYGRKTELVVNGSIPAEGPLLCFSNHFDYLDVLRMYYAARHAAVDETGEPALGRIPRGVAKSTLFGIPEATAIKKGTGKKDLLNSDNPMIKFLIRHTVGATFHSAGIISMRRSDVDRRALKRINRALQQDQAVASAITQTRDGSGSLTGLKLGAAFLLKSHSETPYCLVAISRDPHILNISETSTYAKLEEREGYLSFVELTMKLADGIMKLQPPKIQEAWFTEKRAVEYAALPPDKRIVAASTPSNA